MRNEVPSKGRSDSASGTSLSAAVWCFSASAFVSNCSAAPGIREPCKSGGVRFHCDRVMARKIQLSNYFSTDERVQLDPYLRRR